VGLTDAPGTRFGVRLLNDVVVNGRVVLPSGTKMTAHVASSRRLVHSSDRLTVDLAAVDVHGHSVALTTTGAVPLESYTSSRGVSVSRGAYQVPAGRRLHFQLGKPLHV